MNACWVGPILHLLPLSVFVVALYPEVRLAIEDSWSSDGAVGAVGYANHVPIALLVNAIVGSVR